MWTPDYFVRLLDFPPTVEGVTIPNDDGTFDIYLSRRLSPEARRRCLEHELRHIRQDHFYKERPVEALELEASGEPPMTRLLNVFDLPDPAFLPLFDSLDSFNAYITALTRHLTT